MASKDPPVLTPDGRYIVVRGRLWRAANPSLPKDVRERLIVELMAARRDVGRAMREGDPGLEREARLRVDRAKVALGERGPTWWSDGALDFNRKLVRNSPYAEWFEGSSMEKNASGE
jgi:hypothetical protein